MARMGCSPLEDGLSAGALEFRSPGASVRLAELSLAGDGPGLVAEMLGTHKASRSSLVTSALAPRQGLHRDKEIAPPNRRLQSAAPKLIESTIAVTQVCLVGPTRNR